MKKVSILAQKRKDALVTTQAAKAMLQALLLQKRKEKKGGEEPRLVRGNKSIFPSNTVYDTAIQGYFPGHV